MGLPFFIFQMEGFVDAVLDVFPIVGVYIVTAYLTFMQSTS